MVLLVVTASTATAVACLLSLRLPFFIADEAGMRLLRPARGPAHRTRWIEPVLVACAVLLAVAAALVMVDQPSPTTAEATPPRIVTEVFAGLTLGAAAGATPMLTWVDIRIHRLPDRIVLPLLALIAVCSTSAFIGGGHALVLLGHGPMAALGIGVVCGVLVLAVSVLGGRGRGLAIGLGDVKLAVLVGAVSALAGTSAVLAAFVIAQVSAVAEASWRTCVRRQGLSTRLAYGPHLLLGMWTGPLVLLALR